VRVGLITGGAGGIGKEICRQMVDAGYKVIATTTSFSKRKVEIEALTKIGVEFYELDVSNYDQCKELYAKLTGEGCYIDTLVNNAGTTNDSTFKKMSYSQWESVININLIGTINVTNAFIKDMIENNFGRIVNISSINALKGQFGQCNYSASKAGLIGFTKSLATEVAKSGVTVNAISPGYIKTEMTDNINNLVLESIIGQIPMNRLGKPEEIAHAVLFVADEKSSFISGENLNVNGAHF